jgi:putative transposase
MIEWTDDSEDKLMARLAPKPLHLTDFEREQLTQIVNRHSTPQQIAFRASIILLADQGQNHQQIATSLNISRDMARLWRNRWLALSPQQKTVLERLSDAERSGTPATFSLEQILQIFAIACEKPDAYGRPISHWTARELADEVIAQGIVQTISPRHIGRLMNEADLKPQQSQYWLNPPPTQSSTQKLKTSATPISERSAAMRRGNALSASMK